jgi:hypothetical protein
MQFVVGSLIVGLGVLFIIGGLIGWKSLVDPPQERFLYYPPSLLRCIFSAKQMRWVIAVLGSLYAVAGVLIMFRSHIPA